MRNLLLLIPGLLLVAGTAQGKAYGLQCEVNGQPVSTSNGATTAGKTGLMRCTEGEDGLLAREQELKNGEFVGIVRYYKAGVLQREYTTGERRNKEGLSREFAATPGASNPVLLEEAYRNGTRVGLMRRWDASGVLRRTSFSDDTGRELASAEFNVQGRLTELRCAPQAVLAPAADDAAWCGHRSGTSNVALYDARDGRVRGSIGFERGELRKSELLGDNGKPREQVEATAEGGVDRSFSEAGTPLRERRWVNTRDAGETRVRRTYTLEQSFSEAGTRVAEKRWVPSPRGAELQLEQHWYLNGQPKDKQEYVQVDGKPVRRDTDFHDNGRVAFEGAWLFAGRYERQAQGVHKSFDDEGRPRHERHHDAKGRVTREREWDASGALKRDDEVFEDGSRKAFSR